MDNGNAPATKKDLQDLESRLDSRFDGRLNDLESRLEGKRDASEQRVLDKVGELIHDAETRLLGAFYTFAESNQKRVSAVEMESSALKSRLATIEDRLTNVEK